MKSEWKKGTAGAIAVTAAAMLTTATITTTAFAAKVDIGWEENVIYNQNQGKGTPSNAGKATPSEAEREEIKFIPKKDKLENVKKNDRNVLKEAEKNVLSGKLGDGVIWTCNKAKKVMTISGTGDME